MGPAGHGPAGHGPGLGRSPADRVATPGGRDGEDLMGPARHCRRRCPLWGCHGADPVTCGFGKECARCRRRVVDGDDLGDHGQAIGTVSVPVPAPPPAVTLRYFAAAREAAGTGREPARGATVAEVLAAARSRHGDHFAQVLAASRVWVNGEPAPPGTPLAEGDEVAVLPPVSGGR